MTSTIPINLKPTALIVCFTAIAHNLYTQHSIELDQLAAITNTRTHRILRPFIFGQRQRQRVNHIHQAEGYDSDQL